MQKLDDLHVFLKQNLETFVGPKTQNKFLTEGTALFEQLIMLNELNIQKQEILEV